MLFNNDEANRINQGTGDIYKWMSYRGEGIEVYLMEYEILNRFDFPSECNIYNIKGNRNSDINYYQIKILIFVVMFRRFRVLRP